MSTVWLIHLSSSWAMSGLILFVHLVHYPLFGHIDRERYSDYQHKHMRNTTWIVMPLMLAELSTAILLPIFYADITLRILLIVNLLLVILIWLSTFLIQVPHHQKLLSGYTEKEGKALVRSNLYRTILWPAHALLVAVIMLLFPIF